MAKGRKRKFLSIKQEEEIQNNIDNRRKKVVPSAFSATGKDNASVISSLSFLKQNLTSIPLTLTVDRRPTVTFMYQNDMLANKKTAKIVDVHVIRTILEQIEEKLEMIPELVKTTHMEMRDEKHSSASDRKSFRKRKIDETVYSKKSTSSATKKEPDIVWSLSNAIDTSSLPYIRKFPGAMPKSLNKSHLINIYDGNRAYYCALKNDGERYLLMFTTYQNVRISLVISRKGTVYVVPITVDSTWYDGTIMDSEIVVEKNAKGQDIYTCIIFECLCLKGEMVGHLDFTYRLNIAQLACVQHGLLKNNWFNIRMKHFYKPDQLIHLLKNVYPSTPHKTDGIILMPMEDPYVSGTHDYLYKLKFSSQHTIDFKCVWDEKEKNKLNLWCVDANNKPMYWASTHVQDDYLQSKFKCDINQMIVECQWNEKTRSFMPIRIRNDKSSPNPLYIVEQTWQSLQENLQLTDVFPQITGNDKVWMQEWQKAREREIVSELSTSSSHSVSRGEYVADPFASLPFLTKVPSLK